VTATGVAAVTAALRVLQDGQLLLDLALMLFCVFAGLWGGGGRGSDLRVMLGEELLVRSFLRSLSAPRQL
jgi:hypothetical protein